jgi:hypothetical protein
MTQQKFDFSKNAAADPIEAWIDRLIKSKLNTTARALGFVLAHRFACGCPNPLMIEGATGTPWNDLTAAAGLHIVTHTEHRKRAWNCLRELGDAGLIKVNCRTTEDAGKKLYHLVSIEVLSSRGGA